MQAPEYLEVFYRGQSVYTQKGKWLHPLFELEQDMRGKFDPSLEPDSYLLCDRIVGKAAAALIVRLGFHHCHCNILSHPGRQLFERYGIKYKYHQLVEYIQCQTERILKEVDDLDQIYQLLVER